MTEMSKKEDLVTMCNYRYKVFSYVICEFFCCVLNLK